MVAMPLHTALWQGPRLTPMCSACSAASYIAPELEVSEVEAVLGPYSGPDWVIHPSKTWRRFCEFRVTVVVEDE